MSRHFRGIESRRSLSIVEAIQAFAGQGDVGVFCQSCAVTKGSEVITFGVVIHTAQVKVNLDIFSPAGLQSIQEIGLGKIEFVQIIVKDAVVDGFSRELRRLERDLLETLTLRGQERCKVEGRLHLRGVARRGCRSRAMRGA